MKKRLYDGLACISTGLLVLACMAGGYGLLSGRMVRAQSNAIVGRGIIPPSYAWASNVYVSGGHFGPNSANQVQVSPLYIGYPVTFGNINVQVTTGDASHLYSFGIYTAAGVAVCTTTAADGPSGAQALSTACSQGTVTISQPGLYVFAITGGATTLQIAAGGATVLPFSTPTSTTTTTSGQLPASIAVPSLAMDSSTSSYAQVLVVLE